MIFVFTIVNFFPVDAGYIPHHICVRLSGKQEKKEKNMEVCLNVVSLDDQSHPSDLMKIQTSSSLNFRVFRQ